MQNDSPASLSGTSPDLHLTLNALQLNARVAIVHPWLFERGGGERVVDALLQLFPNADLFALIADPKSFSPEVSRARVQSSFLSWLPGAKRFYQQLMPLYPLATGGFDLTPYDLVISSGGPATKGVIVRADAKHLHYCHTPVRFLWDQFPVWRSRLPGVVRPFFTLAAQNLREADFNAAQRVDQFVANSAFIATRIWAYYRRTSTVIYPPVDVHRGYISPTTDDYYLTVGRLVVGKRIELLIDACEKLHRRLLVVGAGPQESYLRARAGKFTQFCGRLSEAELSRTYARARAFVFAAEEDFGIAPVEAQSFGRPVIAYGKGGCLETIVGLDDPQSRDPTGLFFREQSADAICDAIQRFENLEQSFEPPVIQRHAGRFGGSIFRTQIASLISQVMRAPMIPARAK